MLKFPWNLFYSLGARLYFVALSVASLFHPKAKEWVAGRKQWRTKIGNEFKKSKPVVWMHCASLGEFEQGKPVLDILKAQHDIQVVVSFFSPSGFKKKNLSPADYTCFIPADNKKNATDFLNLINPTLAIFVKYEFWGHHLNALESHGIPHYLISAHFKPNHFFFKTIGHGFLPWLKSFDHIFLQNGENQSKLKKAGIDSITVTGDTRIDRVLATAENPKSNQKIEGWLDEKPLLIAGSIWAEDDALLMPWLNEQTTYKVILAPHELDESRLSKLEKQISKPNFRFSQEQWDPNGILILDNIGMLADLYAMCKIAYVGGAFRTGLHNILEPAVFGIPIIFGPSTKGRPEAVDLILGGAAISVQSTKTFTQAIAHYADGSYRKKANTFLKQYFQSQKGAAEKVCKVLTTHLS